MKCYIVYQNSKLEVSSVNAKTNLIYITHKEEMKWEI